STEAKSLLAVLPELRGLDVTSLGEVFACGCVLQNRTLFKGVSLLPGGSAWIFSPGSSVEKRFYFEKQLWEEQPRLSPVAYAEALSETWVRVLPKYLNGRLPVALALTGGLDSRLILAWLGKGR